MGLGGAGLDHPYGGNALRSDRCDGAPIAQIDFEAHFVNERYSDLATVIGVGWVVAPTVRNVGLTGPCSRKIRPTMTRHRNVTL